MPETITVEVTTYTLAELKELGERGYDNALDWLRQGESEFWDGLDELDAYIQPEHFGLAGITFNAESATWSVGDYSHGGAWFALPKGTDIDVPVFLRAMQAYYEGRDYRGPQYAQAERKLIASPRRQHKIDLRSRDARLAKEDGLRVTVIEKGLWSSRSSDEFDFDPYYRDEAEYTDEFKADCNEFLSDLCHEAARILELDYESRFEEEYLIENAEINDFRFTEDGKLYR